MNSYRTVQSTHNDTRHSPSQPVAARHGPSQPVVTRRARVVPVVTRHARHARRDPSEPVRPRHGPSQPVRPRQRQPVLLSLAPARPWPTSLPACCVKCRSVGILSVCRSVGLSVSVGLCRESVGICRESVECLSSVCRVSVECESSTVTVAVTELLSLAL